MTDEDYDDDEEFEDDEDFASDEVDDDDYDEEFNGGGAISDDMLEKPAEDVTKANPKRVTPAQRKKNRLLVEGIIEDIDLHREEGAIERVYTELMEKADLATAKDYSINAELTENDVIEHAKFGTGFVVELMSPTKVEVLFEDGLRKLVFNQHKK